MCEPTTWIMVAGMVISAAGSASQGAAQKKAAEANAKVQTIMANDALERGKAAEASQRRKTAALKGQQAARFGAGGGEVNTGSALEILADTAEFGELDALRIRSNAEREAFGFLSAAAISTAQGKNAQTSGNLKAAGSIIGAAGMVSGKWDVFKADKPTGTFGDFLSGNDPVPGGIAIGGIE
jgi:hypothetical protein